MHTDNPRPNLSEETIWAVVDAARPIERLVITGNHRPASLAAGRVLTLKVIDCSDELWEKLLDRSGSEQSDDLFLRPIRPVAHDTDGNVAFAVERGVSEADFVGPDERPLHGDAPSIAGSSVACRVPDDSTSTEEAA